MLIFSAKDRTDIHAFEAWRSVISSRFVPLRPEPVRGASGFFAELRGCPVGSLALSEISTTAQRVHRGQAEIARSQADMLFLNVQMDGESALLCDDRAATMRAGDLFLVDGRRPFVLACETPMRHLCVAIPRSTLIDVAAWDRQHARVIAADAALATVFRDYLRSVASCGDALAESAKEEIADHLLALMRHMLIGLQRHARVPREALRAATFARARRIIAHRLGDAAFDAVQLAGELGVSLRYLQVLFAEHGTAPMREIMHRRTQLAMRLLRDPGHSHRSITDVALACGFRDLSGFGRRFFEATGQTPRAWRRGGAN
jgi:AraC-like DNA-binding protein